MCNQADCIHGDDLDDDLTDIFGCKVDRAEVEAFETFQATQPAMHAQNCKACKGSGKFRSYTGRIVGDCFTCKGTGQMTYKTSPEQREKRARSAANRKAQKMIEWAGQHEAEIKWLAEAAGRKFGFAISMLEAITKWGSLTDNQLAAVRKLMTQDQLRQQEREMIEARAPQITGEQLDKIVTAFETAIANKIKYPKLRLDTFIFSPVRSGKNAGAIYVKHAHELDRFAERRYLGKIVDRRFIRSPSTQPEEAERIVAAAMDPEAAAKAYGQREGVCSICGRKLTKNESIDRAIGPICQDKFGW